MAVPFWRSATQRLKGLTMAGVALLAESPSFVVVSPQLGVKSLAEFNTLVRAQPGKYSYGSSGTGSVHHLATETLKTRLGLNLVHVPYKGSPQAVTDLLAGRVQVMFSPASTSDRPLPAISR